MHPERGGSAVFARYAFNELISFVAGWAIFARLHDPDRGHRADGPGLPGGLLGAARPRGARGRRRAGGDRGSWPCDQLHSASAAPCCSAGMIVTVATWTSRPLIIVLGPVAGVPPPPTHASDPPRHSAELVGPRVRAADRGDRVHGLRGRREPRRRGDARPGSRCERLVGPGLGGDRADLRRDLARRGRAALPVHHGMTALGTRHIKAPLLGVAEAFHPKWLADVLKYAVAIGGALGLVAAAGRLDARRLAGRATRSRPTARSRAPSGACTDAGARHTS